MRVVIDNDVLVRAALSPNGGAYRAMAKWAEGAFQLLRSPAQREEFLGVLERDYIRDRLPKGVHADLVGPLDLFTELVDTAGLEIRLCRDPKDDKILEAAVAGSADLIVTTDGDLLALSEVQGIPIIHLHTFLDTLGVPRPG